MTTAAYKPEEELTRLTKAVEVLSQEVSESPARDWFRLHQWEELLSRVGKVGDWLGQIHPCPDAKKRVLDAIDDEVRTERVRANEEADDRRERIGHENFRHEMKTLGLRTTWPPFPLRERGLRMTRPDREVLKWRSRKH